MPRIGRSFPPQWVEPNIGGADRALGPEPPQRLFPPALAQRLRTVQVTSVAVSRARAQPRYFPLPGWDETDALSTDPVSSPILDSFNRADEDPLSGGGNWATLGFSVQNLQLLGGVATPQSGGNFRGDSYWTPSQFGDSEAIFTLGGPALGSSGGFALYLRWAPGSGSGYRIEWFATGALGIERYDSGTPTTLASGTATISSGDKVAARVVGSTIEVWQFTAGAWKFLLSAADTTYTSGNIGFGLKNDASGNQPTADDFGVGSLVLATPILDNFNRANENPLSGGGNWLTGPGANAWRLVSNAAGGTANTGGPGPVGNVAYWAASQFADCEAYITSATGAANDSYAVLARVIPLASTWNGYGVFVTSTNALRIYRIDGSVWTRIDTGSVSYTPADGDKLAIRCVGTRIEAWVYTAGAWSLLVTANDATYARGYVGVYTSNNSTTPQTFDDFGGGSVAASLVGVLVARRLGPQPPLVVTPPAPPPQPPVETTITTVTAGAQSRRQTEARRFPLQGWDGASTLQTGSPYPVYLPSGGPGSPFTQTFGDSSFQAALAQPFPSAPSWPISSVVAWLLKVGAPSDNVVAQLQTDSGGKPSGTVIASASVAGTSLGTSTAQPITFVFPSPVYATGQIWLVISRSGAVDGANFYRWGNAIPNVLQCAVFDGATWTSSFAASLLGELVGSYSPDVALARRLLGPRPTLVILPLPSLEQQSVGVALTALARRNTEKCRFPLQGWEQVPTREGTVTPGAQTISVGGSPNSSIQFGTATSFEIGVAQQFQRVRGRVSSVAARLGTVGAPADQVVAQLQTDSGGVPSGTVIATSAPVTITSTGTYSFTFANQPEVTQTLWVVFQRTGALSDTDCYTIARTAGATDAEGYSAVQSAPSTTWIASLTVLSAVAVTFTPFVLQQILCQRLLGPRPPLVIQPLPSQPQQTVVVRDLPQAVVQREQAQQRQPHYALRPPTVLAIPPPPPGQYETNVTLAVQARRLTEKRRFPLQGWEQEPSLLAASQMALNSLTSGAPTGGNRGFGTTTRDAIGQQFARLTGVISNATAQLFASGSVSDNIYATIQSDAGGVPSGTVLATSASIAGSSLVTSAPGQPVTFVFPDVTVTGPVWLVIQRDGAADNVNFYQWVNAPGSAVAEGGAATHDSGTWNASGRQSASVQFYALTQIQPMQRRFLGPRPPLVILPLPSPQQQTVAVHDLPQAVVQREQAQQRAPKSLLRPAPTLAQPPPETVVSVTNTAVAQRRLPTRPTAYGIGPPLLTVQTPTYQQATVATTVVRTRPRLTRSRLQPPTVVSTAVFVAPPITTRLVVPDRIERRRFNSFLAPPTVLQTFAGPQVTLAHTRPRRFAAKYVVPATLEPEAVSLAERQIRTVLVRTRPRHTVGTRLSYTVYPATTEIAVTLVRARPRPTHVAQRGLIFYAVADTTIFVQNVRTRPRPTTKFVKPPATLQPYSVTIAEDTIRVALARTRPRPTTKRLAPPTVLQVFTGPATPFVHTRPRPTTRRLSPPIFYAQTSEITVALVRTRPRPTRHTLGPLIFYAVAETPNIAWTVKTRPRPTTRFLAPPATLTAAAVAFYAGKPTLVQTRPRPTHVIRHGLAFYAATSEISVTLARTRPRPTAKRLTAATYPATSEIAVTLVRTRPRPTRHALTAVTYAQAGVGFVHLVRARPRHTVAFVAPPATLEPESVALAERQIHTPLIHTRPRPTISRLTAVTYPATSEIQVTLVRIRPRPTVSLLTAITYAATSEIQVVITRTRPRPTTRFLLPPATLQPYAVTIAEDTVRVALVHTRPRHTLGTTLGEPTTLQTFAGPEVTIVRARPRPTVKRVQPPTVVRVPSVEQREQTITTKLVRTRPRPTESFIREPLVKTFPPVVTTFLPARLVQTRPRPTRKFLRPPTVVIPLPTQRMQTLVVWLDAVRTRREWTRRFPLMGFTGAQESRTPAGTTTEYDKNRRGDWNYLIGPRRPMATFPVPAQREQTVKVFRTRIRPRHTLGTKLGPPTTLQVFGPPVEVEIAVRTPVEDRAHRQTRHFFIQPVTYAAAGEVAVTLVRTRPRPTTRTLGAPTVLRTFQAAAVTLVATRPRPTRHFIAPPTTLQTFGPPAEVEIAVRTPLDDRAYRRTRSFQIRPVTFPATSEITVTLVRTRPRPTSKHLAAPTAVVGFAFYGPTVHTVRARPRPTTRFIEAPAVVTETFPPVVTTILVRLVTIRPPQTHAFRIELHVPPRVPPKPGFTTGIDVAASGAFDTDIGVTGGAASSTIADGGEITDVGSTGGASSSVIADEGEILDQPGGLT